MTRNMTLCTLRSNDAAHANHMQAAKPSGCAISKIVRKSGQRWSWVVLLSAAPGAKRGNQSEPTQAYRPHIGLGSDDAWKYAIKD